MTQSLESKLNVIELVNSSLLSFVELRMQCRMCILLVVIFNLLQFNCMKQNLDMRYIKIKLKKHYFK
jgi:hypothetical protein